jgi:hypothetical protein
MRGVLASMATIRLNRPTGAAVALTVLLGVVALATVVGLTAGRAPTGEAGLTTRPWTVEQMVLPAKPLMERVLAERRDDRSPAASTLGALLLGPVAALLMWRSVVARHRRRCPAAAGWLGCVGSRAPPCPWPV